MVLVTTDAFASAPFAATQPAFMVTSSNATFNGMAVPNGELSYAWFEWGTNTSYGQLTEAIVVGAGAGVIRTSAMASNLASGGVYAFRYVVSNASGVKFGASQLLATGKKIAAWGDNSFGQISVPPGLTQAVSAVCGQYHSLALDVNGKTTGWGWNAYGQTNIPTGLTNVLALAAGVYHSLALKSDGTVIGWGDNFFGQSTPPAGATNVVAVAAGRHHSVVLRADGSVLAWGYNFYNQTNVPAGTTNVVAIACGDDHALALVADGTVRAWGDNIFGECTVPANLSNVVAIAAGDVHSLALKADGSVVEWGWPLTTPAGLGGITAIAAGNIHCLALNASRIVTGWGADLLAATLPPGVVNVSSLSAAGHNLVIADNTPPIAINASSNSPHNQDVALALPAFDPNGDAMSFRITSLPATGALYQYDVGVRGALIGLPDTLVSDAHGRVIYAPPAHVYGSPVTSFGFLANDGVTNSPSAAFAINLIPTKAAARPATEITAAGAMLNGSVLPNGEPTTAWFEWGPNGSYGSSTAATNVGPGNSLVQLKTAISGLSPNSVYQARLIISNASVGMLTNFPQQFTTGRRLAAWGSNVSGQTNFPAASTNFVALAAGGSHNLALRSGGTVLAWGLNTFGQTNVPSSVTNVVALAAGGSHSLALRGDGRVLGWGRNNLGQTNVPPSLTNVLAIAAGANHSVAVRQDGGVVAWGDNTAGQTNVAAAATNVIVVAAGVSNSYALRVDGSVVAWGGAAGGLLNVPSAATNIVALAAGNLHVLALRANGSVIAWGTNNFGQTNVPAGLSNVVAIGAGANHSLAVRADGSTVAWGQGNSNQTNVPAGLSSVSVAGGALHSVSLGNAAPAAGPLTVAGYVNRDVLVTLVGTDINQDALGFRMLSLPLQGTFYQYDFGNRGAAIDIGNPVIADSSGRIIYAPAQDSVGTNFALFVATDGLSDSAMATLTLGVELPAAPSFAGGAVTSLDGVCTLTFTGTSNAAYSVWASTNLTEWDRLGTALPLTDNWYQFTDMAATNWPQRFYRAVAP